MATNTIAGVNPQRISQLTLDALQSTVLPILPMFVTNFSDAIAESGNTVTTRFVTNPTVQNFSAARSSQNSVTTARTVTLNNYVGIDVGFNDTEVSFSDVQLSEMYIRPAIVALFENVMTSVLSLFTASNFSGNTVIAAANFNSANIAGLATSLNTAKASSVNRSLIIPPTYADTMRKDTNLTLAYAIGSAEYLRTGRPAPVHGFTPYEYNGTIPNNSENLAGVALAPQAVCLAARQPATPRNWAGATLAVSDPTSGLTLQWRDFYDNQEQRTQLCLIYGTAIGVTGNGWRIRSS